MNSIFEKRIKDFKSRLLKRKYAYFQFDTANGIWLKLKVLTLISNKISGIENGDIETFKLNFPNEIVGSLYSLKKSKLFLSIRGLAEPEHIDYAQNIVSRNISEIINSDYNIIIFYRR